MKNFLNLIFLLVLGLSASAQKKATLVSELPSLFLSPGVSLHLISPEPIRYVDIADNRMVGDLPEDNILRLKFADAPENSSGPGARGPATVITIVGQSFIAQYAVYPQGQDMSLSAARQEIQPEVMQPLELAGVGMSSAQMKDFAMQVMGQKRSSRHVKSRHLKMTARLNNLFTIGDYVFVDLSFTNKTRLHYDIDSFRFLLKDKRITRATNVQDVEFRPEYSLYHADRFQRSYRNVFVFRKFTFPGNKQFCVQLTEKQVSGRTIELAIDYSDLLHADTL